MIQGGLRIDGLSVRLGRFRLRDINLHVAAGENLVLLGPNGAGKSVCLETIAGFHRPERGRIAIDGRELTALAPEHRRIAFLFQNFGLFPHRSVAQNVAMGGRGRPPARAIAELLERFGIAALADYPPQLLSPGEKQRTALARALLSRPDVFLFDEPFSALDAASREPLRDELAGFLRQAGTPAIFVTHDPADAAVLADRLAVIEAGVLLQSGPAAEVLARPSSARLAHWLGVENILDGRLVGMVEGAPRVAIGAAELRCAPAGALLRSGDRLTLCLRAGEIMLYRDTPHRDTPPAANHLSGKIVALRDLGALIKVTLDCGFALTAHLLPREARALALAPGREIGLAIDAAAIHLVPPAA